MPIYQTARYQVTASAVDKVKSAIAEFVEYVATNEPGSRMYTAWQEQDDPTKFVHLFEFADEAAHQAVILAMASGCNAYQVSVLATEMQFLQRLPACLLISGSQVRALHGSFSFQSFSGSQSAAALAL